MLTSEAAVSPVPNEGCSLCPRLHQFRNCNRNQFPNWHNAPVPSFGHDNAQLLVVGLAPGLRGANRTGRPFTGDYAGQVLYQTLSNFGLASGCYDAEGRDDFVLVGCRITNAVRCVPPKNRPTGLEVNTCNQFLAREIRSLKSLRVIVALGMIAHAAVLNAVGEPRSTTPFRHGLVRKLRAGVVLADSYHCSRLNINTGRLNREMFEDVFSSISDFFEI